ncbi:MAG: ribbon-helix-helix protein, CopG family [Gammaproteobacteria bacterium]|nr:ribbon-helix-helix protein, CopG family [Gammaproteobacteria bacterium]MDH3506284.1 ribbon-helix-helix protein, CopG family [Gammaproteobacteria bacterium]
MVSTTIKSTYSLDVETVRELEAMAQRWNVSKSEALRRAIHSAARDRTPGAGSAIEALDDLQSSLGLTAETSDEWERAMRRERRASAKRLER